MKTTVKAKTLKNVMRYWGRGAPWTRGGQGHSCWVILCLWQRHRHHMINQYLFDEQISKVKRRVLINKCRYLSKF